MKKYDGMRCLIWSDNNVKNFCKDSFLEVPVFHCNSCNVLFSGDSIEVMREKCKVVYERKFWGNDNLWDAKKIIDNNYQDDDSNGKRRTWVSQYAYCKEFLNDSKDILEIGAGQGQAAHWFEEAGHKITAIEPDASNSKLINEKLKNGKCIEASAEKFLIDEKFDIVWVSHVLEHMIEPEKFLKNIQKCMKNEGILFIEVPNCENKVVLRTSIEKVPHTFHFSMKSLLGILERNGFVVKKNDYLKPAAKINGIQNKLSKKTHPYYPRIVSNSDDGKYFRIIAKKEN